MKNRIVKGTLYLMLAQLTIILSGYLIHIILARKLGPAVYGNFGFILSLILITKTIFLTGMNRAISKYISEQKERAKAIYREGTKIQLVLIMICLLFYLFFSNSIANLFNDPSLTKLIRLSSLVVLPLGLYVVSAKGLLNGLHLFRYQAFVEAIHSILKLAIAVALVYLGLNIFGAVAAYIIAPFLTFLVTLIVIKKQGLNDQKNTYFNKWTLIKFALPITFFYVAITITMELGLLFVKGLLTNDALTGYYTSAVTLSRITFSLFTALTLTMLPSISSAIAQKNTLLVRKYINKSLRYSMLIVLPITILISTHAKQLIIFLYSSDFVTAALPLSVLVFGFTFFSFFMIQCSFLLGANKPHIALLVSLFTLILVYILNITLIPIYGLMGAAIATTLTGFSGLILISIYNKIFFGSSVKFFSTLKIIIASTIIYFIAYNWSLAETNFILSMILLSLIYIILLLLCNEVTKEDINLFKSLLKRS